MVCLVCRCAAVTKANGLGLLPRFSILLESSSSLTTGNRISWVQPSASKPNLSGFQFSLRSEMTWPKLSRKVARMKQSGMRDRRSPHGCIAPQNPALRFASCGLHDVAFSNRLKFNMFRLAATGTRARCPRSQGTLFGYTPLELHEIRSHVGAWER